MQVLTLPDYTGIHRALWTEPPSQAASRPAYVRIRRFPHLELLAISINAIV